MSKPHTNIETFRLSERAEVVATNGSTMHARMAQPTRENAGTSDYLVDDGRLLPPGVPEIDLGGNVTLARSATGGLALRSGRLREVLGEAEVDALVKLRRK